MRITETSFKGPLINGEFSLNLGFNVILELRSMFHINKVINIHRIPGIMLKSLINP